MTAIPAATTMIDQYSRLRPHVGRRVTILTARDRYTGTLRAVHTNAVWIELRDDCLVAVTDDVISVAPLR